MIRILAPVLAAVWIFSVLAWQLWDAPGLLVLATTIVNLRDFLSLSLAPEQAVHAAEEAGHDLSSSPRY